MVIFTLGRIIDVPYKARLADPLPQINNVLATIFLGYGARAPAF
jgi:hypothetical protein